jgi:hypothetical protein
MIIKRFSKFQMINEESSPRLPIKEEYWTRRGKSGKKVALYTHDDLDGIFCAIEMQKWLRNKGFEIVKYGLLNYSEGWKYTTLDPTLINIVLDFANMPGDERDSDIDYYLDHHGLFSEEDLEKYKNSPVQKKKTNSAYEAICLSLGVPQDELTLSVIDMVDSAKYDDYGISWQRLLDFNLSDMKKSGKSRLEFAAAFNQFLKRSDTKTILSVIYNTNDASIYAIYNTMKKIYPEHNIFMGGPNRGQKKEFVTDSLWRLGEMQKRTRGFGKQKSKMTGEEFIKKFWRGGFVKPDGYQLIGDLVFVPTGTWANALRARTIVEKDFMGGKLSHEPKFILLQYGGTLQVCSYKNLKDMEDLPSYKDGSPINDLGVYMSSLLENFIKHLGYYNPDTSIGQDEITVSGGHGGIGSISNIFGVCMVGSYKGLNFLDMFKNKIISDLGSVNFPLNIKWNDDDGFKGTPKEPEMDNKNITTDKITKIDKFGKIS